MFNAIVGLIIGVGIVLALVVYPPAVPQSARADADGPMGHSMKIAE